MIHEKTAALPGVMGRHGGYTLLEIMLVVIIVSLFSTMSVFAVHQAADRRYTNDARRFQIWLQHLSDRSTLEGAAYGVFSRGDEFRAAVFYRQMWFEVDRPEPFKQPEQSVIDWRDERTQFNISPSSLSYRRNSSASVLPMVAMLPGGYIEPKGEFTLIYPARNTAFKFRWDEAGKGVQLGREEP